MNRKSPTSMASTGFKAPAVALELKDISKSFGARDVLSKINLSIDSGCLVITGRNGSGKSTLLKIIARLIQPTEGEVVFTLDGNILPSDMRRDLVGMVAPDLSLYDELSAIENLKFFAEVRGIYRSDDEPKSLLDSLGLQTRENDLVGAYSSGMKQRIKYAFAVMHNPPVLLLDEPSANLDEGGIEIVDGIIKKWRERGIVVLATNEKSELGYGDKILELGA
ncbi:MAG: ABC transporter ATP-binding protein [Armatimonadota bacterium]